MIKLAIFLHKWYNIHMVFTPLRVERHRMNQEQTSFLLFACAIFTIGILFGSLLASYGTFPARTATNLNTSAVILSHITTTATPEVRVPLATETTTNSRDALPTEEIGTESIFENAEAIDGFFSETLTLVRTEVEEKTARTNVLSTEIERLTNASVVLIAGFEQSCGNWADTCATAYKNELDKNNASYNRLSGELELLLAEIERAQESERIILASQ